MHRARGVILLQVDMATYGRDSWALTSLGVWRDQSLHRTEKSAEFVKSKQREARRSMLSPSNSVNSSQTSLPKGDSSGSKGKVETEDSLSIRKVDTRSIHEQGASLEPPRESIGNSISGVKSRMLLDASSAEGGTQDAPAGMAIEEMES